MPAKPAPIGADVVFEDARIPMRDGVRLAADVVRVDDGRRRPALLVRTPYSRAGARINGTDLVAIARADWVYVNQDVRGRYDSEGCFTPFHQEIHDGHDSVAWCAAQPWCDGNVAMWGGSYVGATQLLAAISAPPALRAITPMLTASGYDDGWCYEGGAMQLGFLEPWAANFVATGNDAHAADRRNAQRMLDDHDAAFLHPLGGAAPRRLFSQFPNWLRPDDSRAWNTVDIAAQHHRVNVPGFHVGGWYDIFCEGTLRNFTGLQANAANERARRGQRLVVGPWSHFNIFQRLSAELDFGPHAFGAAEMLGWTRRAVAGEDVDGGVRIFVMGENRWRDMPSWPPPSKPLRLYLDSGGRANSLHGDGVLRSSNPAEFVADRYRYDPKDPVPTRGGRGCGPYLPTPGPSDQRDVEARKDVLVYTTEPMQQALTLIGMVTASISFVSSAPSADVTVKLVDVHPDGRPLNVVDSVRRIALVPGEATAVEVAVGSTAMVIGAGHRLRVEVSSSNFPRLDRNPSTGEPAGFATGLQGARQTVLHGGDRPSWVELPVVAD
jgi:putative CocE/NonD family hydrolase